MSYNIFNLERELFLPTYNRIPLEIEFGRGVYLYTKDGTEYLDFFSGLAVNALGYAHPGIVKAVTAQISRFGHLSNSYITEIQTEFTKKLLKYSGMKKAFLTNSGAEAVEASLKLIRKEKGKNKKVIAFTGSFHGRTYGALSLTERHKYRIGFEPLLPNIKHLPFNNIPALIENLDINTAAVFVELIQGEGGIFEASRNFISELVRLKNKYDFILVVDEIQTGMGRTGYPFSYNIYNIVPDIIVTAKAIGGGLPLGAMLTQDKFSGTFTAGSHGTTFGGNPVSCAAGLVVLNEIFENKLIDQVRETGKYFKEELVKLQSEFLSDIREVRGEGLMIGVELDYDGEEMINKFRERKILVNVTNQNVIRILPPLIIANKHVDIFIDQFRKQLSYDRKN